MVDIVSSTSWEDMEPVVENTFAMFGNLEVLTTDGGPPYNSNNFARYMKKFLNFPHFRKSHPSYVYLIK